MTLADCRPAFLFHFGDNIIYPAILVNYDGRNKCCNDRYIVIDDRYFV